MRNHTVIVIQAVTPALRGTLTRWMLEPSPGVFVGPLPARVRSEVWKMITSSTEGHATFVSPANNEQGYALQTHGPQRRLPQDFDGLTLIRFR